MSDYRADYFSKKEQVLQILQSAESFLREHGYDQEAQGVGAQRRNLESGEFSIALIGEFSAGKSTFLNALMHERILPSYKRETTATINFLRHKEKAQNGESGCVYYKDGSAKLIHRADLETISRYVSTESKDVDVARMVDHLDLFLDSKFLEDNVMLVDTPGLNGIARGHKEITQGQIERSSAGIFLFDAHKPGSSTDFEILSALSQRVKSILLVLNQIDVIGQNDESETVESVIENLKASYRKLYPDTQIPEIWPVSAYKALVARSSADLKFHERSGFSQAERARLEAESGMGEFEERLWKFLTRGEKARQMLLTPVTQAIRTLAGVKDRNKANISALEGKVDTAAIEGKLLELEKAITELQSKLEEQRSALNADIREKEREFFNELAAEGELCRKAIARQIENFTEVDEISPDSLAASMERKLTKIGTDAWIHYTDAMRDLMALHCQSVTENVNDMLNMSSLGVALDCQLTLPEFQLGLENYAKRVEELEQEKSALDRQLERAEDDWAKEIELRRQRESIQEKIKHEEEKRDALVNNKSMLAPDIDLIEREVSKPRDCFLGPVLDLVLGKQKKMEPLPDDTRLKAHDKRYNALIESSDRKIEKLEAELRAIGGVNVAQKEKAMDRLEQARQEKAEALRQFQESAAADFKRKNEVQLRKLKRTAQDQFEDLLQDFRDACSREFRNQRQALQGAMTDGIRFSISQKIELLEKDLAHQKHLAETAVGERDAELDRCGQENDSIRQLLKALLEIQSDLENTEIDTIKQEVL